jgi:hypothetical protein
MFRQLHTCMVWGQVGYGQACIAVLETAGKGKSLGLLARAIAYRAYLGGRFLCMDFIQLQSKRDKRNVEDLNDPRFKRIAKPSSPSLATGTYKYIQCSIPHQLSIVQYMLPPKVNAQASIHRPNNPEGPSQRHLDAPRNFDKAGRVLDGKAERSALLDHARNNC